MNSHILPSNNHEIPRNPIKSPLNHHEPPIFVAPLQAQLETMGGYGTDGHGWEPRGDGVMACINSPCVIGEMICYDLIIVGFCLSGLNIIIWGYSGIIYIYIYIYIYLHIYIYGR
jgi:hypothetical protein